MKLHERVLDRVVTVACVLATIHFLCIPVAFVMLFTVLAGSMLSVAGFVFLVWALFQHRWHNKLLWETLVPRGWVFAAFEVNRLALGGLWDRQWAAMSAVCAAFCRPSEKNLAAVDRIRVAPVRLTPTVVLVEALLSELRGHRADALTLLESIPLFPGYAPIGVERALATAVGLLPLDPKDTFGERHLASVTPHLWLRVRTQSGADESQPVRPPSATASPLTRAMAVHAELLDGQRPASWRELEQAARLWDEAFADEATRQHWVARGQALAVDGDSALEQLRTDVIDDLAGVLRSLSLTGETPSPSSETLDSVLDRYRQEEIRNLQLAAHRLGKRADEKRPLPLIDEWREWVGFYRQCSAMGLQSDSATRRDVYLAVGASVFRYAAWMVNARRQREFGGALYFWLLAEAEHAGDTASAGDVRRYLPRLIGKRPKK